MQVRFKKKKLQQVLLTYEKLNFCINTNTRVELQSLTINNQLSNNFCLIVFNQAGFSFKCFF